MTIREALCSDAEALLSLLHKLDTESEYMLLEPNERNTTVEEQQNIIRSFSESPHRFMFVAQEKEICGFCVLNGNPHRRTTHVASLVIGVSKIYWRQGIGSALLNQALAQAANSGIKRVELTVRIDNLSAISLYEKFGFEKEGIRRNSLRIIEKPTDELYMAKLL
jgi:RimJ/RimL family protein N-acetyltransferase